MWKMKSHKIIYYWIKKEMLGKKGLADFDIL